MRRALTAFALLAAPLFADDVHLRGGGRLTGEIVEQTSDAVVIDIGAGRMTVPASSVVGIDEGQSPLQEYRARAATIAADDVAGWRQLARWATDSGLAVQADEAYERVRAVHPDDAEATRALGLVRLNGNWVSEAESYEARGFVKFEGDWMTPNERDSILAERQARYEAEKTALGAEIRASEAERQQREAEEEAREAEEYARRHPELPVLGDPVYWGFGSWP